MAEGGKYDELFAQLSASVSSMDQSLRAMTGQDAPSDTLRQVPSFARQSVGYMCESPGCLTPPKEDAALVQHTAPADADAGPLPGNAGEDANHTLFDANT